MDISAEAHSFAPPLHLTNLKTRHSSSRHNTTYVVGPDGVLRSFATTEHDEPIDAVGLSPWQIQAHIHFLALSSCDFATSLEDEGIAKARTALEKLFEGVDGSSVTDRDTLLRTPRDRAFQSRAEQLCAQLQDAGSTGGSRKSSIASMETPRKRVHAYSGMVTVRDEVVGRVRGNSYYSLEGR